jgi:hypothetical protein
MGGCYRNVGDGPRGVAAARGRGAGRHRTGADGRIAQPQVQLHIQLHLEPHVQAHAQAFAIEDF